MRSGAKPALHAGAFTSVDITLVSSDARDLACSMDKSPWGYSCKYRADGSSKHSGTRGTLVPCLTATRLDLLVPDLFAQPALAERVARDDAQGLPRGARERFTARCRVRILSRVTGVRARFSDGDPFGEPGESWLAWPVGCTVHPQRG